MMHDKTTKDRGHEPQTRSLPPPQTKANLIAKENRFLQFRFQLFIQEPETFLP